MKSRKRGTSRRRAGALLLAVILGIGTAGTVAAVSFAGERPRNARSASPQVGTVACADAGAALNEVPEASQDAVDKTLAELDVQVADAYTRLSAPRPDDSEDRVLGDLATRRTETLKKLSGSAGQDSGLPQDVSGMAKCVVRHDLVVEDSAKGYSADGEGGTVAQTKAASLAKSLPRRGFVDIRSVSPNVPAPVRKGPATGSFTSQCGRNENRHLNPDNVIVAPGVSNGAHHMHDYVGNVATDAFSSNAKLAASGTTCSNGDQSAYYWPVLRVFDGTNEKDAKAPGGGKDRNVGRILTPAEANITYTSSAGNPVQPMARFLRIITGDAKAFTNGPANVRASWSCTGFENRQVVDKYPICPQGSRVVRTLKFPDCWDGKNIDSANHRTHTAFSNASGSCPKNFKAIPQLVERVAYDVPAGVRYAVDSFPEQLHNPITDHGDFINNMNKGLLDQMVGCINQGRRCG
ncbi:DUF1996 domain-containing protein [Kitasatospora sp. RG8]|uniref:DUF1996 domain-containing protein n=1 Tax=Kitasatospora sp. RG8 TaxID=2820815 RepID=UPI001AE0B3D0|nr:DUF1996 domain-containing protein [Kitasatospora sp. RG8]MBP0453526.1 DUF1996 domain-containing protein [Kitasatospora sp. RG8]